MAEKNLSPRQKMINLMYLVLTALLALNVSAEVLTAFVKMEQSIRKGTKIIEQKNEELYSKMEKQYQENKVKVGPWYRKAMELQHRSNSLFNFVQELKVKVVRAADGPKGDPTNIHHKDDNNVGGQVMILEGGGKRLKDSINAYRDFLLSLLKDTATQLGRAIKETFDTRDIISEDKSKVPWEYAMFDQLPLIAVVANLSKIQNDIRTTESSVLSYLLEQVGAGEWKFNKLEPIVYSKKGYVLQGETYEAQIFIAAYDTTQQPIVMVNGQKLPVKNGKGIYKVKATKVGTHKFGGVIMLKSPITGEYVKFPFKGQYEVAAPAVAISPTKMNVFYLGVDNPVAITASGVPAEALIVKIAPIGTIKKVGSGQYIVRVNKLGKTTITVYTKSDNGQLRKLGSMTFRCKTVPDPKPRVGNLKPGPVPKVVLLAQQYVRAELENFVFDLKFPVVSFTVSATIGSFTEEYSTKGARITQQQKDLIKQLRPGQKVYFEDIKARAPDGSIRDLGTISFRITR